MAVQVIPHDSKERVETGAVQFGDDWPGLFIRGDNAAYLAHNISIVNDWYNSLPEAVKAKDDLGVAMALANIRGIMKMVHNEVIVK